MATRRSLYLHEEILLLALKDEKGTFVAASYEMALGGAILAELLLQKRIGIENGLPFAGNRYPLLVSLHIVELLHGIKFAAHIQPRSLDRIVWIIRTGYKQQFLDHSRESRVFLQA